jgi:hypothetical protein
MQAKILREQINKRICKQKRKEKQISKVLAFQYEQEEEFCREEEFKSCSKTNTRSKECQHTPNCSSQKSPKHFTNSADEGGYAKDNKAKKRKKMNHLTENRKADPGIFCICRGMDDGISPMLQCDMCKDWFHFACVNISDVPKVYKCPICKDKSEKNFWERGASPLDLLILAAENIEKSVEVKSENSESKSKTIDEVKDNSHHSHDEDPESPSLQLTRTARLVLESPK